MGESLIGLGHLVGFLTLADGAAGLIGGIHQFTGQLLGHASAVASTGEINQPPQGHRCPPLLSDFHGHLVGGTPDPTGPDFNKGGCITNGGLE